MKKKLCSIILILGGSFLSLSATNNASNESVMCKTNTRTNQSGAVSNRLDFSDLSDFPGFPEYGVLSTNEAGKILLRVPSSCKNTIQFVDVIDKYINERIHYDLEKAKWEFDWILFQCRISDKEYDAMCFAGLCKEEEAMFILSEPPISLEGQKVVSSGNTGIVSKHISEVLTYFGLNTTNIYNIEIHYHAHYNKEYFKGSMSLADDGSVSEATKPGSL